MEMSGVTVGKFMPLHRGHELMIKFGSQMLDELFVFVSGNESDEIPLSIRLEWVREFVRKENLNNVVVICHMDQSPIPRNIDENGTVLDEDFQEYWVNQFSMYTPNISHIVSSDMYGKVLADRMLGVKWLPVDIEREMISISGTVIRANPKEHFDFISDSAKPYFVKKIAFVGAESSGKSTATKTFAKMWNVHFANEYGRTLTTTQEKQFTEYDFYDIMKGQDTLIRLADQRNVKDGKFITLTDTEAYITYLFSKIYLGRYLPRILDFARQQKIDKYIVLAPNTKWVNDGTRVMDDQQDRIDFHEEIIRLLEENDENYTVIDDPFFTDRQEKISRAILKEF
jgi:HTH-type transcriptional repressor of NAD biosynthesis genes